MQTSTPISRRAVLGIVAAVAGTLAFSACSMLGGPPAGLDLARSHVSAAGKYAIAIAPNAEPVAVGALHTWTIEVRTADGAPVAGALLGIDGGMPQHGHGYPTRPRVTESLGDGRYLLEGMKFNMPGWWTLVVAVDGPAGADKATFNIVL